jgi:replicative DNA helicase
MKPTQPTAIDLECLSYERIIIGTCLLAPDLYGEAAQKVAPRDFVDPDHALVWQMLADYYAALPATERNDVELWLGIQPKVDGQEAKTAERVNRLLANYVANYSSGVVHNLWHACESVATYAAQARYRQAVARLTAELDAESNLESRALIANAIAAIPQPVGSAQIVSTASHAENVLSSVLDGKAASAWVCPTGLQAFDTRNGGGLHPGRLYVVAGRPGWGKSAIVVQWIASACRNGFPCALASLEMTEQDLILRIAAYISGVYVMDRNLDLNPLQRDERMLIEAARDEIKSWPLHLRCGSMTAQQFAGWASDLQQRAGVKVVALDYLQRVSRDPRQPKHEAIAAASQVAKDLSLQGLAVIVAAQLNREAAKSSRPSEDQLGGADQISQDADCLICPWRPEPDDAQGAPVGYAELLTLKGRRTVKGRVAVRWIGHTQSYVDSQDPSLMTVSGKQGDSGW